MFGICGWRLECLTLVNVHSAFANVEQGILAITATFDLQRRFMREWDLRMLGYRLTFKMDWFSCWLRSPRLYPVNTALAHSLPWRLNGRAVTAFGSFAFFFSPLAAVVAAAFFSTAFGTFAALAAFATGFFAVSAILLKEVRKSKLVMTATRAHSEFRVFWCEFHRNFDILKSEIGNTRFWKTPRPEFLLEIFGKSHKNTKKAAENLTSLTAKLERMWQTD